MKKIFLSLALILGLNGMMLAQQHTFPATDTNNTFTGTNTFNNSVKLPTIGPGCLAVLVSTGTVASTNCDSPTKDLRGTSGDIATSERNTRNISINRTTFTGSTDAFFLPAPGYAAYGMYLTDTTLAMRAAPEDFTVMEMEAVLNRFLGSTVVSGTTPPSGNPNLLSGTLPQSLNQAGVVVQYHTGFDGWGHYGTDQMFGPILAGIVYDKSGDASKLVARLAILDVALSNLPRNSTTGLVTIVAGQEWVPWGFQEYMRMTGDVLTGSLWYYHAANQMARLAGIAGLATMQAKYTAQALAIKVSLGSTSSPLWDATDGTFYAATGQNMQPDNLGAALACSSYSDASGNVQVPQVATDAMCTAIGNYFIANIAAFTYKGFFKNTPGDWAVKGSINSSGGTPYTNAFQPGGTLTYQSAFWNVLLKEQMAVIRRVSPLYAQFVAQQALDTPDPTQEYLAPTATGGTPTQGFTQNMVSTASMKAYMRDISQADALASVPGHGGSYDPQTSWQGQAITAGGTMGGNSSATCWGYNWRQEELFPGSARSDYNLFNGGLSATRICQNQTAITFQYAIAGGAGPLMWQVVASFDPVSKLWVAGQFGASAGGFTTSTAAIVAQYVNSTVLDYNGGARLLGAGPNASTPGQVVLGAVSYNADGTINIAKTAVLSGTAFTTTVPGIFPTGTTVAGSAVCTTATGCGGSGTVTSFAAPSGSWPTWLVPTVTNSNTTPSLAVAVGTIPASAGGTGTTSLTGVRYATNASADTAATGTQLRSATCTGTAIANYYCDGAGTWTALATVFASPPPLGSTTPNSVAATTVTASGTITTNNGTLNVMNTTGSSVVTIQAGAGGAFQLLTGTTEAANNYKATGNTSGQQVMRLDNGNIVNRLAFQRLNDAANSITSTPWSISNASPTNSFYMSASGGVAFGSTTDPGAGAVLVSNLTTSTETVAYSATPSFSGTIGLSEIILTGNVTSWTLASPTATTISMHKCIHWIQDSTGGRTATGTPANVKGAFTPGTVASRSSQQCYNWSPTRAAYIAESLGQTDIQ